jgi:hypothetical protein
MQHLKTTRDPEVVKVISKAISALYHEKNMLKQKVRADEEKRNQQVG